MRLFVAIDPDEAMRQELVRYMNELRTCGMQGVYTKEENLHLTLAFIGGYGDPDEVLDAMEEAAGEEFALKLNGIGSFADIWWAGFEENEALDHLVMRLRHALAEHGIPYDRKAFKAHCTLVRKGHFPHNAYRFPVRELSGSMIVQSLSLYRSQAGKNGMVYTRLGEIDLFEP